MIVLPIIGLFLAGGMRYKDYYSDTYTQTNYWGWCFTASTALFFLVLCTITIVQLDKPEICAYYENKDGIP
jgi:hypothetical protein